VNSIEPFASGSACPSDAELIDFSRGHVAVAMADAIGRHLSECMRCAASLASLAEAEADADGQIVHVLRRTLRPPAADPYSADPECQLMTQRAKQLLMSSDPPMPDAAHAPAGEAELTLPFLIGQYQLVAKIGEGGMGTVYRALHMRLKKPMAVKVLRADRTSDCRAVARFQREMEAIGRLEHVHIVRATDAGEAGGVHFLVMELIDGINLSRLVAVASPIAVADACAMIRQAALGLQCAHEHQLVHRDLKPSNLLLSARGELKILDLGLARLQEEGAPAEELTAKHHVLGTGDYMAPEQWQSSHEVDIRADIYSLGCTLFYLLAGEPPFGGIGRRALRRKMSAHMYADLPPLPVIDAASSRGLRSVLERMLAKDASERYAEPGELADALSPYCAGANLAALAQRGMARPADGLTQSAADSTGGAPAATPVDLLSPSSLRRPRAWRGRRLAFIIAGCVLLLAAAWMAAPYVLPRTPKAGSDVPDVAPKAANVDPPMPEFATGRWHDLLDRKPVKWHWFDPNLNSLATYSAESKKYHVQSTGLSLHSLGRAAAPGFTVRLLFRQEQWTGGVGVFFGGHKDPATKEITYEVVQLGPGAQKGTLALQRLRGSILPREGQVPLLRELGIDASALVNPLEPHEYFLEIRVDRGGLTRVAWDGAGYDKLVDRPGRAAPVGHDYQGEFGLFCRACSVTLHQAAYLPTE
jgi:serine/threonine protein kinase